MHFWSEQYNHTLRQLTKSAQKSKKVLAYLMLPEQLVCITINCCAICT